MKLKNTLTLLVIAAGLFGFIWFWEKDWASTPQAADNVGRVVRFDRDEIKGITIKNTGTTIELSKSKAGAWTMKKPLADRADLSAIIQLFTAAEALKSEALASEAKGATKEQLKEFGLTNPETRLTFTGGKEPVELLFGKDAAVEGRLYVRLEDSSVVHVIGTELKGHVTKRVDEYRDRNLTALAATSVERVLLKTPAGEMELGKKDEHWALTKPLKARGDNARIDDLISKITNAQVSSFAGDAANLTAFGLQEPRGTITLFTGDTEQPTVLQVGGAVGKEQIYVKLSTRDAVCVVPQALEALLDTKPNDLRDKQLLRVEADLVDRMSIEGAGKEKIVVARRGESWVRKVRDKDEPINARAAARLLHELRGQQVASFVADLAKDLPKYGLDQPAVKVTLSSYASENTAETKSGERPIVSVLFGKTDGDKVYAKLDDEPYVVSVPATLLEVALTDPLQWQDLGIYRHKADEITAVEITRAGQPTLTLARAKEKQWVLAKGDGKINQTNVQSLVNTLATLRAIRWIGATSPAHGLGKPALKVTFQTSGGATGTLTAGAATPEGTHHAIAEGLTGTFALSRPDFTAFELPLLEKPAAAAPPPPAPAPVTAPAD